MEKVKRKKRVLNLITSRQNIYEQFQITAGLRKIQRTRVTNTYNGTDERLEPSPPHSGCTPGREGSAVTTESCFPKTTGDFSHTQCKVILLLWMFSEIRQTAFQLLTNEHKHMLHLLSNQYHV